jgi:hypothetical protein
VNFQPNGPATLNITDSVFYNTGLSAILIQLTGSGSAQITIERTTIEDSIAGINATNSASLQLNITDTLITNNSKGTPNSGILIGPTGSGTTGFAFERIRVENNPSLGINVSGLSATGTITGVIRESVVSGSQHGISVITTTNNSAVAVSLDHTHVANNDVGVSSIGGAAVILNNSTIQVNNTGLFANNGGAIFSYGNNAINGNQPGGIGTPPIQIGFH